MSSHHPVTFGDTPPNEGLSIGHIFLFQIVRLGKRVVRMIA